MPSVLMDEMLALLDGHQPCMLFEQLLLNRIPDGIRLQLADADFADPRKVAELADELWQSISVSSYSTVHKVAWPWRQVRVKPTDSAKETDNIMPTGASITISLAQGPSTFAGNAQAGRQ